MGGNIFIKKILELKVYMSIIQQIKTSIQGGKI